MDSKALKVLAAGIVESIKAHVERKLEPRDAVAGELARQLAALEERVAELEEAKGLRRVA